MQQTNVEVNESLHAELVRRVMALEGREETLRLNNMHLESTIETLAEYTSVSPEEIRGIAKELARSSTIADSHPLPASKASWLTPSRLKLACVILIALVTSYVGKNIFIPALAESSDTQSVLSSGTGPGGLFHKKAMFASAMADVSTVKMLVTMHLYENGEFPVSISDLGLEVESMTSSHVSGLKIEENGTVLAKLPEKLGDNREFKLIPKLVMGGHNIEWNCYSNLPAYILSGTGCKAF